VRTDPPGKLNEKIGPIRSLYFGIYYSVGFQYVVCFAFSGVFSGDFGF